MTRQLPRERNLIECGTPRLVDLYQCPNGEGHELAAAPTDNETAVCVDCMKRVKLVRRAAPKMRWFEQI